MNSFFQGLEMRPPALQLIMKVTRHSILGFLLAACQPNLEVNVFYPNECSTNDTQCSAGESASNVVLYDANEVQIIEANQELVFNNIDDSDNLSVTIDGNSSLKFTTRSGKLRIPMPSNRNPHRLEIILTIDGSQTQLTNVYMYKNNDFPLITASADVICSNTKHYDADGVLRNGNKECNAEDIELLPENLREGVTIGNITGTLSICSNDGEKGCISNNQYPAVETSSLAGKIVSGQTVAGLTGTYTQITLPTCTTDGETSCESTTSFRATNTVGLAAKVVSGQTVAGINGSYIPDFPSPSNVLNTDTTAGTSGTLSLPLPQDVLNGTNYGSSGSGLTGTLTLPITSLVIAGTNYGEPGNLSIGTGIAESHSNCTGASQVGCLATSVYKSMDLSNRGTSGAISLTATNFQSRVTSTATLEYWDRNGNRHTSLGDPDLVSSNLKNSVTALGISGNMVESPANCSSNGSQACVATGLYFGGTSCSSSGEDDCYLSSIGSLVTANLTNLDPRNIRAGTAIAGVTGNYVIPTISNVESGITYGSAGTEFTGVLTVPTASNVGTGVGYGSSATEYTGTAAVEAHTHCTGESQVGCVSHTSFVAVDTSASVANKVLQGQSVAGINGNAVLPGAGLVLSGQTFGSSGGITGTLTIPSASNVLTGTGNYGVPGSPTIPSYTPDFPNTSSVVSTDTVNGSAGTILSHGSWDMSNSFPGAGTYTGVSNTPVAGNIKRGVIVSGVTGNYPSTTSPLKRYVDSGATSNESGSDIADLNNFSSDLASSTTYEFWDSSGIRYTGSGDADLSASNIRSGTSIHGITGSATPRPTDCSSNGEQNCVSTGSYYASQTCSSNGQDTCFVSSSSSYSAADLTNLSAGNIKSGESIAGTTGSYPSSTYPLPSASVTSDLENATFNIQIKSASSFEFWTSDGTRQTATGDTDIQSSSIKSGVSIFGTVGTYTGP